MRARPRRGVLRGPSLARCRLRPAARDDRETRLRGPAQPDLAETATALGAVPCRAAGAGACLHLFQPHDPRNGPRESLPVRCLTFECPSTSTRKRVELRAAAALGNL